MTHNFPEVPISCRLLQNVTEGPFCTAQGELSPDVVDADLMSCIKGIFKQLGDLGVALSYVFFPSIT